MEPSSQRSSGVIHGNSGASVYMDGSQLVTKVTSDPAAVPRLCMQANYMRAHGYPFVKVLGISDGAYTMERLYQTNHETPDDTLWLIGKVKDLAAENLWVSTPYPGNTVSDINAHIGYVKHLCTVNELDKSTRNMVMHHSYEAVRNWWDLTTCKIHGDLALDNVMLDDFGKLTLIDAIPPTVRMPSFRACDLGKLLQSAAGYESWRYPPGEWGKPDEQACIAAVLKGEKTIDSMGALYFRMLAWLRMLRYTQCGVRSAALEQLRLDSCDDIFI